MCQRAEMSCSRLLDQLAAMAVPSMRRFEQGYADCYKHFQVRGARSADTQESKRKPGVPSDHSITQGTLSAYSVCVALQQQATSLFTM